MKKNIVRGVALALVLLLALSALPLGALADDTVGGGVEGELDPNSYVSREFYDVDEPTLWDYYNNYILDEEGIVEVYEPGTKIKVSDWDKLTEYDGKLYDFIGFQDYEAVTELYEEFNKKHPDATEEDYVKFEKKTEYPLITKDIKTQDPDKLKDDEWFWQWYVATYAPHKHKLTCWIADPTNHWRNCLECKEQFIAINWHYDNDADDFCDVCGGEIYYYDVTELEVEGGKVTADLDTARFRDIVNVKVEAEDGYKLVNVHFYKVRPDGSKAELTRRTTKRGESYWFKMPSFNVEVTAEFVKAN